MTIKAVPISSGNLPDSDQSYWQLGSILGTSLGLPAMSVGGKLAASYGAGEALVAVLAGNLVLWLIGLGIIGMTLGRENAIGIVRQFLGRWTSFIAALVLVVAFIFWYSIQLGGPRDLVAQLLPSDMIQIKSIELRASAALGVICALLALGGIRVIKWICVVGLPALVAYQIYTLFTTTSWPQFQGSWGFSSTATLLVAISWLPGIVNVSTFTRHARSKADSFLALSLMTIIHIWFQMFTILIGIEHPTDLLIKTSPFPLAHTVGSIAFVLWSFFCINLVNIYYASAGWEAIIPYQHKSTKELAIIGLLGTLTFTFLQQKTYMIELEQAVSNFIACLGVVLLVSFLLSLIVQHRPRPLGKVINSLCWYAGCVAAAATQISKPGMPIHSLLVGVGTAIASFLLVLFIEEVYWSITQLQKRR